MLGMLRGLMQETRHALCAGCGCTARRHQETSADTKLPSVPPVIFIVTWKNTFVYLFIVLANLLATFHLVSCASFDNTDETETEARLT